MNRDLHLDHDEHGGYLGFSHGACNRLAGASKGGQVRAARYGTWNAPKRTQRDKPRTLAL